MAEVDVEALRGAIAALRAVVANNDTEHCEQCALSTIPGQDALICAVEGCQRLPPTLDERGPVRALLPLLAGLLDRLAAWQRLEQAVRGLQDFIDAEFEHMCEADRARVRSLDAALAGLDGRQG